MKAKRKIYLLVFILVCLATVVGVITQMPQTVRPLPQESYSNLKKALVTKGTELATVTILSGDNRSFSGTLVNDGMNQIIITVAHSFAERYPNSTYTYVLDGKKYPIQRVYSHPKPGTFGGKDIAFCLPGQQRTIKHYWKQSKDTTHLQVHVGKWGPFRATLLSGVKTVVIKGTLASDEEEPIYAIEHKSHDGDSGSGVMIGGQTFFVLKGNLKESTLDTVEAFGIKPNDVTLITEL